MNEIKLFDITDLAIQELKDRYSGLTITGIDDKEGYQAVSAARKVVKGYRVDVDKRRKELNEDALKQQRAINGEAKRITEKLSEIEDYLAAQEKHIDDALAEIKAEEQRKIERIRQFRIDRMVAVGFRYNGNMFTHVNSSDIYPATTIYSIDDAEFGQIVCKAEEERETAEKLRRELEAHAERKAAEFRADQERVQAHLAAEREKLAAMRAQADAELAAERAKLAAERIAQDAKAKALADQAQALIEKEEAIREAERLKTEEQFNVEIKDLLSLEEALEAKKQIEEAFKDELVFGKNFHHPKVTCEHISSDPEAKVEFEFTVKLSGTFHAKGTYKAESEERAAELAVADLLNDDVYPVLFVDFELDDNANVELIA